MPQHTATTPEQARRNKRLALVHVVIALGVLAAFVLHAIYT